MAGTDDEQGGGFTAEERAAMKERAAELRAESFALTAWSPAVEKTVVAMVRPAVS